MQKLLIAVDSPIITDILKRSLEGEFTIYTCNRGDEALQLLESIRPDVLIINLALPHVTGLSVLQKTHFTPPVVLALTYYLSNMVIQEATAAGVGDLLLLPCSLPYILSRLRRLLHGRENPSS